MKFIDFVKGSYRSCKNNKYEKGDRRMPWRRKAMKDVSGCDKPREGAYYPMIRGCLNGETRQVSIPVIPY